MSWPLHKSLKMTDYERELAEWGFYPYDFDGIGLHARIKKANAIDKLKVEFEVAKAKYEQCKADVESCWNAQNFRAYTDASWNFQTCKEDLIALMRQ